jgi:predicted anti-sigma-YlaC factor YlaD
MSRRSPGCGSVRGDLGFLLVPEHDPERAAELRGHLAGCMACRAVFAEVRANFRALRSVPAPEPGPAFSRKVMDRLPRKVPRRRRKVALALVPLVALVGLGPGAGTVATSGLLALPRHALAGVSDAAAEAVRSVIGLVGSALASSLGGGPAAPVASAGLFPGSGVVVAAVISVALVGLLAAVGTAAIALVRRPARLSS